jgi:hypothetical protein
LQNLALGPSLHSLIRSNSRALSHSEVLERLTIGERENDMIDTAVTVYTLSPGRAGAIVAVVVGLIGAVVGGLAVARSAGRVGTKSARRRAIVALVLGPIGLLIGGLVVVTADGGVGTGNGFGGGVVAVMVSLIAIGLGGLALARSRRTS